MTYSVHVQMMVKLKTKNTPSGRYQELF